MQRKYLFVLVFTAFIFYGISQNININIFHSYEITEFTFTADSGKYDIISNNKIVGQLLPQQSFLFKVKKTKIRIYDTNGDLLGNFKELHIRGRKQTNMFIIAPKNDKVSAREYDNDLYVYLNNSAFKLINDVNFEKYIAGVVESEGGASAPIEYYKTQAILCRTYALKYFDKHLESGFSLCDDVHCQAYKGRCKENREIYSSAVETAGLVIVDDRLRIISATFFANSGGETANSEDVWLNKVSYLRAKKDTFSFNQPGSAWEKTISIEDWNRYLNTKQITVSGKIEDYKFTQNERKKDYSYNSFSIPLKTIRKDWMLRSTYFTIEVENDNLIFKGKGYGHGVGLSQEGAMQMARMGFHYEDIIKQYYTNVKIMSIKALDFFQIE